MQSSLWISQSAAALYQGFWVALDWLYPPFCAGCGNPGTLWCPQCQTASNPIPTNQVCSFCGIPRRNHQTTCARCQKSPPPFIALRSWATFSGPLRKAIHSLKYQQNMGLGSKLAEHMIVILNQMNWPIDLIVPMPLSAQRFAERGYNQANLLARPIAFAFKTPFTTRALKRIKNTRSQVGLTAADRLANVHGAFEADPGWVQGKTVLLVDDVATTGATLAASTQALLTAGAQRVYAITLARANHKNEDSGGG